MLSGMHIRKLVSFLSSDQRKYKLDEMSMNVMAAYLAPLFFKQQGVEPKDGDPPLNALLRSLSTEIGSEMPGKLVSFYQNLPQ